jgi:tRNA-dihydrouridine synthase 2
MVRASTTPLRILALSHGASLTFTEEFIDRSILDTVRMENAELGTIDYVKPLSSFPNKVQKRMVADVDNPDTKNGAILLRIDPKKEKNRLVYQIGTGESGLAIQAVNRIINDVAGVDVNMGCPKKFSVSGGMGRLVLTCVV